MSEPSDKLSDTDIKQLAGFFYLLWQCDERNKREGRYDKTEDAPVVKSSVG